MKGRTYNFSAGPATLPEPVIELIQSELLNYHGTGMSVMEMSHRSKTFLEIIQNAEADLRLLLNIPDNYRVLFIQGGATLQFSMVPMNLLKNGAADYIVSGAWSKKAYDEAKKFGDIRCAATSEDRNFSYIPDLSAISFRNKAYYVYICENETIHGTCYPTLPDTGGIPIVSDQSSMFLSKPCDVTKYGMIFAGVQKNVGPAGMSVVIIREDLIRQDIRVETPVYLRYDTHAKTGSLYNTPNCFCIYACGKVFRHLLEAGGLEAVQKRNEDKAAMLYDFLDRSHVFHGTADYAFRSLMNVPFVTDSPERDKQAIAYTEAAGLLNLKGHKSVGGLRASIYNAMPKEGVGALVDCLEKFEKNM